MPVMDHVHFEWVDSSNGPEPIITLYSDTGHDDRAHHIPLHAIANRMELHGFGDSIQALEFIGWYSSNVTAGDRVHTEVIGPYRQAVQVEAQLLSDTKGAAPIRPEGKAATVISCGASECTELLDRRTQTRSVMGMASEPVVVQAQRDESEECCARTADSLHTTSDCVYRILECIDESRALQPFRLLTAAECAPEFRRLLLQQVEGRRMQ